MACPRATGEATLGEQIRTEPHHDRVVARLDPKPATSRCCARLDHLEAPARTATQVCRIIEANQGLAPSARTVQRLFARRGLNVRPDGRPPEAFGRFEAEVTNALWTGDALHGPVIAARKVYLLAFIDDHSRLLAGYRWCHAEDTVRLELLTNDQPLRPPHNPHIGQESQYCGGLSSEQTSGVDGADKAAWGVSTEAGLAPDADGVARPTVGVDFGGTKALMVACWPNGTVDVERASTGFGSHRQDLEGLVESFVAGLPLAPRAIGLAVPGLVDAGKVVTSDVLPCLEGWEPALRWGGGRPVFVENDVRAGLAHVSDDNDLGTTALIMTGTGIAVAVRTSGVVIAGANGWAGELGSVPLWTAEAVRTLDELASGASVLRGLAEETVPVDNVIAQAGRCLGLGIATVVNLFNPSRLVIGGGALRHEGYLANALTVARTVSLAPSWGACTVEEAADDRLVALGVARLAAAAT